MDENEFCERYRAGQRRLQGIEAWMLDDTDARIERFRGAHAPGDGDVSPITRAALTAFIAQERLREIFAERAS